MEKKTSERADISGMVVNSVIGGLAAVLLCIILLLVFAILIAVEAIPEAIEEELIITTAFISATAGAVVTAKRRGSSPLPSGLCGGVCFLIFILLITALKPSSQIFGVMTIKLLICALSGGAFGGLLGSKQKKVKKRGKRR
jgi:putative membrane protein (TIGR04086 family)